MANLEKLVRPDLRIAVVGLGAIGTRVVEALDSHLTRRRRFYCPSGTGNRERSRTARGRRICSGERARNSPMLAPSPSRTSLRGGEERRL